MFLLIARSKNYVLLTVMAIALAACGVGSENSSTASTVAKGVKNAALTCAAGGTCLVGDTGPGGGKVFYVAPTSFTSTGSACGSACKYLEGAPIGWNTGTTPVRQTRCTITRSLLPSRECEWSGNKRDLVGTQTRIGSGFANTSAMIAQSKDVGKAATVARAYRGGGKSDWFLPSKDELNEMFVNRGLFLILYNYWSSSEVAAWSSWAQAFDTGRQYALNKELNKGYVWPVRAF